MVIRNTCRLSLLVITAEETPTQKSKEIIRVTAEPRSTARKPGPKILQIKKYISCKNSLLDLKQFKLTQKSFQKNYKHK